MSRHEYSAEVQNALAQLGWHGRLNEAVAPDDVVTIVRDYLARWSPEELSRCPASLRPGKFVDAEDVGGYALSLAHAQMERASGNESAVAKLATFFSAASQRLSQILARSDKGSSASSYAR